MCLHAICVSNYLIYSFNNLIHLCHHSLERTVHCWPSCLSAMHDISSKMCFVESVVTSKIFTANSISVREWILMRIFSYIIRLSKAIHINKNMDVEVALQARPQTQPQSAGEVHVVEAQIEEVVEPVDMEADGE